MIKFIKVFFLLVNSILYSQALGGVKKMETLYSRLNILKQETRKIEAKVNSINTINLSNKWIYRKNFINGNNKIELKAIESNIEMIPRIEEESKRIIWCGKIENTMNEYEENLSRNYKLLLDDIEENKIYITKENYKFVAFDDLMTFLVNNTLYSEKTITEMFKKQSTFKEFREFLNYLAKDYVK
ncbi:hypothetical protein [Elizabethkingia meningoseptica]|uniref:hypothetical protein n=1 Tax=Elizabethkingia meningoseptica TaxID=238 RepID=UPI00162668C8|nr:hypothetical protein [Elizabethkingia meningoseptica]HAY3553775.1 hypothetical protein [Elizabethkingia meningoseptica]